MGFLIRKEAAKDPNKYVLFYLVKRKICQVNWTVPYTGGALRRDNRGNLRKPVIAKCQQRSNVFTNRIINVLPGSVVDAINSKCFKSLLDNF